MTQIEAIQAAQAVLGPRARVYREGARCVVARHELLMGGTAHVKIFGVGPTWGDALTEARHTLAQMRAHPIQGVPDHA